MKSSAVDAAVGGREFVNELREGIWVADAHGNIVFANRALARLLGIASPEALTGKPWRELFPAAEAARFARGRPDSAGRTPTDSVLVTPDNRRVPVSVTLLRRPCGDAVCLVGSVIPAQGSAAQDAADFASRQVMENSVDGICILENGRMLYANRRFEELTGYTSSQATNIGLEGLVALRDRPAVAQYLDQSRPLAAPARQEVRVLSRSGREIDCEFRLVPAASDGHSILLCFLRDLSELRQAEKFRTEFIAMVSHDLRTPLASIKEAVSLLSEAAGDKFEERQRRYLTIAREEIDRLNRMIDNLIEVSRMEAGKVTLRLDSVDLAEVVSTAVEGLSLLVSKRSLTIERNIPHRLPMVMGDRDRLLRVVNNLLDNAIKYSPRGGTIHVAVKLVEPGAPVLAGHGILPNTGYVQMTIADEGPGIPAEFLDRIFGKFERVDPYGPGIGLGLAIVRSFVELHHGRVWATSTLGEGSAFHLVLPVRENP